MREHVQKCVADLFRTMCALGEELSRQPPDRSACALRYRYERVRDWWQRLQRLDDEL